MDGNFQVSSASHGASPKLANGATRFIGSRVLKSWGCIRHCLSQIHVARTLKGVLSSFFRVVWSSFVLSQILFLVNFCSLLPGCFSATISVSKQVSTRGITVQGLVKTPVPSLEVFGHFVRTWRIRSATV